MIARFERDIGGGAHQPVGADLRARRGQGQHLGMRFAGALVAAFADDLPVAHDDAAHPGVGRGRVHDGLRQGQGAPHPGQVVGFAGVLHHAGIVCPRRIAGTPRLPSQAGAL